MMAAALAGSILAAVFLLGVLLETYRDVAELQRKNDELEAQVEALERQIGIAAEWVRDDALACTFQSLGAYRETMHGILMWRVI